MTSVSSLVRSHAHIRVGLVMLFLGGLILVSGYDFLREWSALQPALAVVTAVWSFAGVILTGCAVWFLVRRHDLRPLWSGAAAAVVAGLALGLAVLMHVVPCPGPTCVVSRLIVAGGLIFFGVLAPRIVVTQ